MNTLNIPLLSRRSKIKSLNYHHLPPDLALRLTLSGSNYPYLKQIFMVQKRFDCRLAFVFVLLYENEYFRGSPHIDILFHREINTLYFHGEIKKKIHVYILL